MMKRFLYTHPRGMDEVESLYIASMIRDKIYSMMADYVTKSAPVTVVTGRKDYEKFFPKTGTWEGWQSSIVTRCNATTGKRFYSGYVVTGDTCGKATATVLQHALQEHRPVFHYDSDTNRLVQVDSIENTDPDNWTNGFRILLKQPKVKRKIKPLTQKQDAAIVFQPDIEQDYQAEMFPNDYPDYESGNFGLIDDTDVKEIKKKEPIQLQLFPSL